MILTPEYIFRNVEAIRPEFLAQLGVKALVLDVDNTLTATAASSWTPACRPGWAPCGRRASA